MALEIRSEQIDRLAQELAEATGETVEDAVGRAIRERLERVRPRELSPSERERWDDIQRLCAETREIARQTGFVPPSKEELEAMLGFDQH